MIKVSVAVASIVPPTKEQPRPTITGRVFKVNSHHAKDHLISGESVAFRVETLSHRVMNKVGFLVSLDIDDKNYDDLLLRLAEKRPLEVHAISASLLEGAVVRVPASLLREFRGGTLSLERSRKALLDAFTDGHTE
jgi:hypothetical protein